MIIKVNQSELEVYENSDIYVGLPDKGQSFKKWDELNQDTRLQLDEIRSKAEKLIRQTEKLLSTQ